jgi:hypothetical protein
MADGKIGMDELICCGVGMVVVSAVLFPYFGIPVLIFLLIGIAFYKWSSKE